MGSGRESLAARYLHEDMNCARRPGAAIYPMELLPDLVSQL